jgi:hypothetical protein
MPNTSTETKEAFAISSKEVYCNSTSKMHWILFWVLKVKQRLISAKMRIVGTSYSIFPSPYTLSSFFYSYGFSTKFSFPFNPKVSLENAMNKTLCIRLAELVETCLYNSRRLDLLPISIINVILITTPTIRVKRETQTTIQLPGKNWRVSPKKRKQNPITNLILHTANCIWKSNSRIIPYL